MDCFVDDRDGRVLCSHQSDAQLCATKLLWTRVQMGVIRSLQHTTLAELIDFSAGTTRCRRTPADKTSPPTERDSWPTSRSRTCTSPPATSRS